MSTADARSNARRGPWMAVVVALLFGLLFVANPSTAAADSGGGSNVAVRAQMATITAGADHTCVIAEKGTVQCWGDNSRGQLGNGSQRDSSFPVVVSGLRDAVSLAAGHWFTCALLKDSTVVCWGDNQWGQLGYGGDDSIRTKPVEVDGLRGVTAIGSGTHTACAVIRRGYVVCWGGDWHGQLAGQGNHLASYVPVLIPGVRGATEIMGSDTRTCALLSGGSLRCWGWEYHGINPLTDVPSATAAAGGTGHRCAIVSSAKTMCWGHNEQGQLGSGVPQAFPEKPAVVVGLTDAVAIDAGRSHTCALRATGVAACWGSNSDGQIGAGSTAARTLTPAAVRDANQLVAIATGDDHTCAVHKSGAVLCWGDNADGQLGDGTRTDRNRPVLVWGT